MWVNSGPLSQLSSPTRVSFLYSGFIYTQKSDITIIWLFYSSFYPETSVLFPRVASLHFHQQCLKVHFLHTIVILKYTILTELITHFITHYTCLMTYDIEHSSVYLLKSICFLVSVYSDRVPILFQLGYFLIGNVTLLFFFSLCCVCRRLFHLT